MTGSGHGSYCAISGMPISQNIRPAARSIS